MPSKALLSILLFGLIVGCSGSSDDCDTGDCEGDDTSASADAAPRDLVAIGYDDDMAVNQLQLS